jgi:hypothetical protein
MKLPVSHHLASVSTIAAATVLVVTSAVAQTAPPWTVRAVTEAEFAGFAPNAGAGVLASLGAYSLRVTVSRGTHGGQSGPSSVRLGMGLNFGK